MTLIKCHSCTKCGGALTVHNDLQQYECPYCSVFYDYEYFRSRDILDQAAASQKMLQYDSAIEKYEFILKKDPQNFTAIRGKLLCESKINRPEELRKAERVVMLRPDSLAHAEEMADEEGKEYFHRLRLLREIAGFVNSNRQLRRDIERGMVKVCTNRTEALEKNKALLERFTSSFRNLYSQLLELEPEEVKQETLRKSSGKDAKHDDDKQVRLEMSPSCTSCGGELIVNLNRQVYECPFCGLSFDFDIIRDETAVAEAQDALSKQQFLKADAIYKYILTVDPKNFAALRGRILCAAKWPDLGTTIQYAEYYMEKAHIPSLKLRIEEALGACEECDRPFFEGFKNTVPDIEAFVKVSAPSNAHRRNKDRLRKELLELEKEYEKVTIQYEALNRMVPGRYNAFAEGLTPQQERIMAKLYYRKVAIEREMKDLRPLINKNEEGVTELDQNGVYMIGNIRQNLASLLNFEWRKSQKEGTAE